MSNKTPLTIYCERRFFNIDSQNIILSVKNISENPFILIFFPLHFLAIIRTLL